MSEDFQLFKVLLDLPLFEDLDYQQIEALIALGDRRTIQPGEILSEPRTIDDSLIILLNGRLRLESAGGDFLDHLHPVRVIGEMGVFTGQIRSTRVAGDKPSDVLLLSSEGLDEMLEEDPQMGNHILANLIKLLYGRLYDVNHEVESLRSQVSQLKERVETLSPDDPLLDQLFADLEE
jgi:CRP-like cAMP-binding protein